MDRPTGWLAVATASANSDASAGTPALHADQLLAALDHHRDRRAVPADPVLADRQPDRQATCGPDHAMGDQPGVVGQDPRRHQLDQRRAILRALLAAIHPGGCALHERRQLAEHVAGQDQGVRVTGEVIGPHLDQLLPQVDLAAPAGRAEPATGEQDPAGQHLAIRRFDAVRVSDLWRRSAWRLLDFRPVLVGIPAAHRHLAASKNPGPDGRGQRERCRRYFRFRLRPVAPITAPPAAPAAGSASSQDALLRRAPLAMD